jgi:hypothetical protein
MPRNITRIPNDWDQYLTVEGWNGHAVIRMDHDTARLSNPADVAFLIRKLAEAAGLDVHLYGTDLLPL